MQSAIRHLRPGCVRGVLRRPATTGPEQAPRSSPTSPKIIEDARPGRGPVGGLIERYNLPEYAQNNADRFREYASGLGAPTLPLLRGAATSVAGIVTIFVLAYLMVLEAPKILHGFLALFDEQRAERIRRVGHDCAKTITGYITGNLPT